MDNHRRPQTPTRPPEYMIPQYDEEPENSPTNPAAMRLLTSTDEYDPNSMRRHQAYVESHSTSDIIPQESQTKPPQDQEFTVEAGLEEAGLESIPEEATLEEAAQESGLDTEPQPSGSPWDIPAKSSSTKFVVDDSYTEVCLDSNDGASNSFDPDPDPDPNANANTNKIKTNTYTNTGTSASASANTSESQKSSSHCENGSISDDDCDSIPESCKVAPLRVPAIKLKKPALAPHPTTDAYIAHSPEKKYDPAVASVPFLATGSPRKSTTSRLSKLSSFAKSASLKLKKKASFSTLDPVSRSRSRNSPSTYDFVPPPVPPRHRFTEATATATASSFNAYPESVHIRPVPVEVAVFEPDFAEPSFAEFVSASSVPDPFVCPANMDGNTQWPRFAPRPVTCESLADEEFQAQTWVEMPRISETNVMMPPQEVVYPSGQHDMRFPPNNEEPLLPVLPEGSSPRRREHQRMAQSQNMDNQRNLDTNLGRDKVQTHDYAQGEFLRPSSRASAFSQNRPTSRASTSRLHPTIKASASDSRPTSRASTSHVPQNNGSHNNNNNNNHNNTVDGNKPGFQYIRPTSRSSIFSHMIPLPVATIPTYSHSQEPVSSRQTGHSYQPSITSTRSRRSSIMDPPIMAPPDSTYVPFQGRDLGSDVSYSSPSRPWSPQRSMGTYSRPPSNMRYEPSDINGSPRPGTPSSRYGGSPRRPLPPQPMYPATSDISVSMPLHDHEEELHDEYDEDYFESDLQSESQFFNPPGHHARYDSQETLSGLEHGYDPDKNFGPAPVEGKHERRGVRAPQMSRKEVQLINGELVLECKIPTILYSFLPRRDEVEFTHMRYTAVTCDPDDFVERGYKLRQNIGRTARETELFICVTMYNENEFDFTRTMYAVMKNISHFCSRTKSRTWGENGWQKIVVCIVSDGRTKIHPRTLDALAAMGIYQDGIAKNFVNQKAVQAHVYEYTTQVSLDSDLKFKGAEKGIVPCQMIFCLKEKNQRKLNSHRWFFNAFGKALNPNVCILLDVGTRPGGNSLYYLWKAFDNDSNVAGACGEIKAMKGRFGGNLLNPLVASQNFEYKMSNILDKPLESVFGYITVLPGALSAYRYHALQNDETGHGPLSQYFKGETLHGQHADVFTANMYLAEDRILCWELVAKRGERWVLKYVRGCTGETDVPDAVPEFISQRRRWLNGAFFAAVYSLVHFKQIWSTDHTFARKILLHIEFIYQFIQLIFTYFSLANFYLTFYFVAGGIADDKVDPFGHHIAKYIFIILRYTCVLLIATQFILSLGNRPQGAKKLYFTSMVLYSIIMMYTSFACIYIVVYQFTGGSGADVSIGSNVFTNLIISTASTIGLYIVMSLIYLDPWHLITSAGQYFMLLPSYICTLQIYAFCNTHDVTWGTKGDNVMKTDLGGAVGKGSGSTVELEMPSEQLDIDSGYDEALRNLRDRLTVAEAPPSESQLQEDYYKSVRTYMVMLWMMANAILAMAVSEAYGGSSIGSNFYLRFILWSVASLALFRAIGSSAFAIINVVNMAVEGRVRLRLKAPSFGRSSSTPTAGGWKPGSWTDKITDPLKELVNKIRRR